MGQRLLVGEVANARDLGAIAGLSCCAIYRGASLDRLSLRGCDALTLGIETIVGYRIRWRSTVNRIGRRSALPAMASVVAPLAISEPGTPSSNAEVYDAREPPVIVPVESSTIAAAPTDSHARAHARSHAPRHSRA